MMKRLALLLVLLCSISPLYVMPTSAMVNEVDPARQDYTGNGVTTAFPYTFKIFAKTDLEVLVDGTVKTVDTDYTVSGLGVSGGGNVTFITAPASATHVTIIRKQAASQASDYVANEAFPAERIEKDLDKVVMQSQQTREVLKRTLRAQKEEALDMELPVVSARKSKLLGFDTNGLPTAVSATEAVGGDLSLSTVTATGSITARSLATRFAEVYNVKDYGALGDGAADDTAAIQAAFDDCTTAKSGSIIFPQGDYHHTALTLAPGSSTIHCNLIGLGGAGANGVILTYTGTGGTALTIKNNTRYVVENIALEDGGTGAIGLHLTSLAVGSSHSNFTYTNVRIDSFDNDLKIGTTDNKAASDGVFINLETSNATTGILVQGPATGANYSTVFHFIHPSATGNTTTFVYNGPSDSNVTVFKFDSISWGQNTTEFDLQSPCFITLYAGYSESAGSAQFMKSGSATATANSDVLTNVKIEGTYVAYPSTPSNVVMQFNQPGHYKVENAVIATGMILLGGYDDGAAGIYRSQLTVENSTIVYGSDRIQYRAGSRTLWLVRHFGSGYTAEAANNTDDDRMYVFRIDGTTYDIQKLAWGAGTAVAAMNAIGVYTAADTTPTVAGANHLTLTNAGAVSITAFDDGVEGQEVNLLFTDGNTTLVDAAGLQLAGGANFTGSANDILTIVKIGSVWYEKSRSVN